MSVRIRLLADTRGELDDHEAVLRGALVLVGDPGKDYPNRGDSGLRRYLLSTGVLADAGPSASPRAAAEDAKGRRDLGAEIAILADADAALHAQPWYPLQAGDVVLVHVRPIGRVPAYGETYLADGEEDHDGSPLLRLVSQTRFPPEEDTPLYLLRYADDRRRWTLAARDDDGKLASWLLPPGKWGSDFVKEAQDWSAAQIDSIESDHGPVNGWVEQDGGWVPTFDEAAEATPEPARASFYDLWFEAADGLVVIRAGAVVHGNPAPALPS